MLTPLIILENIRSAYNVGNIIRTADALWYDVILSGFTPHPDTKPQIKKTSLGAEESVDLKQFWHTKEAVEWVREQWYMVVVGECCERSMSLKKISNNIVLSRENTAILVGNENTWVLQETLDSADHITHIPMQWLKESLNVGQAAAILMWEFKNQHLK